MFWRVTDNHCTCEGPIYESIKFVWKLSVFVRKTWNYITMYKLFVLDRNTWYHIIVCKLLVLERNTWCYITVCKLFVLDRNTWYHITVCKLFALDRNTWYLCSSMWRGPQKYIAYEFDLTSPAVSCMSGSSNLDSFHDGWLVAAQLLFCGVLAPGLVQYSSQHSCVIAIKLFLHMLCLYPCGASI